MKKLIAAVFSFALTITLFAGLAEANAIGVKGGLNLAKLVGGDAMDEFDFKMGFCGGAFVTLNIVESLAIQPEVLFTMKGTKLEEGLFGGVGDRLNKELVEVVTELNYVEVPVLAKIIIAVDENFKPNVFAGPAVGIKLSAKSKAEIAGQSMEEDLEDIKDIDLGLVVGGGVELGKLVIEGRYVMSLDTIIDSEGEIESDVKNQVISVMAGFSF